MILGVTGSYASGKDTVAEILKSKGFVHFSLSDVLREELAKNKKEITRENLINLGNDLRKKYGPSILAEKLIKKLEENKNYIISSIRNPKEIGPFLAKGNFHLIFIDSLARVRYRRMIKRNRNEKDAVSFREFMKNESFENSKDETKQQLNECKKIAKIKILNNSTLKRLNQKVSRMLIDLEKKNIKEHIRPSWDEYFLNLCDVIGSRGTCDRGRSGCVITNNKRIIATGYVGSPVGLPHCDGIGHQMKATIHEDGKITNHCVRTTHAEQNAIVQAARNGARIEGSTLYCKMTPCYICAKMIINAGIKSVVVSKDYHAGLDSKKIFKQAGIKLKVVDKSVENYSNQ
ncbi:MAG: CMP/dCMP deaminase zinc-binding protein [Berkelbacteria bacterium GW2011_GWA1_36_9]|uniref:CMP/dCMP deaminase zinc-binding protein n=1 Tax=Berkelbacteria bacterium GW2011_GWA1_36_9 TaxID=1618331 RepID=A0A0G0FIP0_9BACT|nr:MAG: CMP/dCMP deaminase zinc-binding protein [Berkelbacteria bacterium GW2011_GWA1_36_9]